MERRATTFGSEFKGVQALERLLKRHPRWKQFKEQLTDGIDFKLEELEE